MPQLEQSTKSEHLTGADQHAALKLEPRVSYLDHLREDPPALAAHLERIGLSADLATASNEEIRGAVIESMIQNRKGVFLNRGDMSVSEYAHADHKY